MKYVFNTTWRDLDPEIWSLAREKELGELRRVYSVSKSNTPVFNTGIVLLVFGIIYLFIYVMYLLSPQSQFLFLAILPGLLLSGVGSYLMLPKRIYAHRHIYLYEAGFLYEKGPLRQVFRWDQIAQIKGTIDPGQFTYKVCCQDGSEVKLNSIFIDVASLIDVLLEAFSRQVAEQELNLAPPRDKKFAQFTLDRQGISDKQGTLPWQDIQELTIEKGTMAILKRKADLPSHEQEPGERR